MSDANARLQALEDAEAIKALCVEYGHMLDTRDYKGYAALFAEDGEWTGVGSFGTFKGRAAIERFVTETFGGGKSVPSVHLMTNFQVVVDSDTATCWSRWTLMEDHGHGPTPVYTGHYDDRLVRTAGGWSFQCRTVSVDIA